MCLRTISEEFDLERLLAFSKDFRPDVSFRYWVRSGGWRILHLIEDKVSLSYCTSPALLYTPCNTADMTVELLVIFFKTINSDR